MTGDSNRVSPLDLVIPSLTDGFAGILLLLAILTGTILRFYAIESRSLWGDEITSLAISTGHSWYPSHEETEDVQTAEHYRASLSLAPTYFSQKLVSVLRAETQAPLYYFLLNLWLHIFGTSEVALRSLSALASICSIPVVYALGYRLSSSKVGAYSALIFSLAPFQIAFAQYNRPYALLGFFALLSTFAAIRLCQEERWRWLFTYGLSAIFGLYTHYLFVWNLVFHSILVSFFRCRDLKFLLRWALTQVLVAGVFLPWVPYLAAQIRWSREAESLTWFYWHAGAVASSDIVVYLGRNLAFLLSVGRIRGLCSFFGGKEECALDSVVTVIFYSVPALILILCAWQFLVYLRGKVKARNWRLDPWNTCFLWGLCIFGGPLVSDILLNSHSISIHRYFIAASAPLYLAVSIAVCSIGSRRLSTSIALIFLFFLLAATGLYLQGFSGTLIPEKGARDVARHLDRVVTDKDLIIVLNPGPHPNDLAYYLQLNPDFAMLNIPERSGTSLDIPAQLQNLTAGRSRVWYIDDRGPEIRARDVTLGWLRQHYREMESRKFRGLDLFLLAR